MISLHSLSKQFGKFKAVDDLTLSIGEGEIFGLIGPNGAGKTTTLRMLCGLIKPTAGYAIVAGHDTRTHERDQIRGDVGVLTETPQLYEDLTARQNLAYIADFYHHDPRLVEERAQALLERLDMAKSADKLTDGYSKGMKQKIAVIRCLLHDPKILFLDEPTSGLDPASARKIHEIIREQRTEGKTIVLCTHNLYDATRLCDKIAIIKHRLLYYGSPRSLPEDGRPVEVQIRLSNPLDVKDKLLLAGHAMEGDTLSITTATPTMDVPRAIRDIEEAGGMIRSVQDATYPLEDLYDRLFAEEADHA